jgi:hypothetical protein
VGRTHVALAVGRGRHRGDQHAVFAHQCAGQKDLQGVSAERYTENYHYLMRAIHSRVNMFKMDRS